jgi:hypothetical protein
MKRILIKEIDRLYSKIHKDRFVSEYIIYLMENDVKLKTITVFGEQNKRNYTTVFLITNDFASANIEENIAKKIIQEVTFEEVIKNQ